MTGLYLFAAIAIVAIVIIVLFNQLIAKRQMVNNGWADIDVQLKRRADLIPNLVEVVRGYAAHERQLLEELTRLRGAALSLQRVSEQAEVARQTRGALQQIFVAAEAYPDLKANQSYLSLHDELVAVEDQIQMARRYYNGTVRNQNILVESVPSNLVAGWFGFGLAEYFGIDDAADRQVPAVATGRSPT